MATDFPGGPGDDTYYVTDPADTIDEAPGEGYDTVHSLADYVLPANVEKLVLDGTANLSGTGNLQSNTLVGNDGDNILRTGKQTGVYGPRTQDTLIGGGGDDRYYTDNVRDVIIEAPGQGVDTIYASNPYPLFYPNPHPAQIFVMPANVEKMVLSTTDYRIGVQGVGNILDNVITGSNGNDVIDGKEGSDTMLGGLGDDTYYVGNLYDIVGEKPGEGVDTVHATISYALPYDVENLVLDGAADIDGVGNALYNIITGNAGNNVLSGGGGGGVDTLTGGAGADTFVITAPLQADGANLAILVDFSASDDIIRLSRGVFEALPPGGLDPDAFVTAQVGVVAQDANDHILYNIQTGAIFYDADGVGGADKIRFAQVTPGTVLTAADFFVF